MRIAIDVMAFLGGILITAGIYLEFGLAFALIAGGTFLFVMALHAARIHNSEIADVSDLEKTG